MLGKKYNYITEKKDLFENVLKDENLTLNHVVIESGKFFPKHPTDAHVYIIIIEGELSLTIGDEEEQIFLKVDVVEVQKDIDTLLGNKSTGFTECFVVKI